MYHHLPCPFSKVDVFVHNIILIPIHLGMHWCLATIHFHQQQFQYFDSLGGSNLSCLNRLRFEIMCVVMVNSNLHLMASLCPCSETTWWLRQRTRNRWSTISATGQTTLQRYVRDHAAQSGLL